MNGEIIGLGNALVDLLTSIESDELLVKLGMPKGSMQKGIVTNSLQITILLPNIVGKNKPIDYSKRMV